MKLLQTFDLNSWYPALAALKAGLGLATSEEDGEDSSWSLSCWSCTAKGAQFCRTDMDLGEPMMADAKMANLLAV